MKIRSNCYCPRCRSKQPLVEEEEEIGKDGQRVIRGRCAICGTRLWKVDKGDVDRGYAAEAGIADGLCVNKGPQQPPEPRPISKL